MKRFWIVVLGLATVSLLPAQSLSMALASTTISDVYTTTGADLVITSSVTVTQKRTSRNIGTDLPYFITFSTGGSGSFSQRLLSSTTGDTLDYQVDRSGTDRTVLKDVSANPAEAEVLAGHFTVTRTAQSQTLSFAVVLPVGQLPLAGTYTDKLSVKLYKGTIGSHGSSTSTKSLLMSITMPPVLDMSLVPEGGSFTAGSTSLILNFGDLSIGEQGGADLIVRSNTSYDLSVSSTYGMVMRNVITTDTSEVPFTFLVNDAGITLSPGVLTSIAAGQGKSGSQLDQRYPLRFTIGDFGFATAGSYRNVFSFTITAR